jgi:diacylglycerol kinase (ATP)
MRVALLYNASAGSKDHDGAELRKVIRAAGHEVVHMVRRVGALTEALHREPCDLVVVAGGDGTVGRTACELSGWQVPISIFPLGTANNTARTLELSRHHARAARGWDRARRISFDIGLIGDGSIRRRFAEAVGWGVFPATIVNARREKRHTSVARTLKRDRKLFRAMARKAPARDYRIHVDGRELSGAYLLVEVMNVPLLGARLPLSPASDPADGNFELVLATEEHRPALEELADTGLVARALPLRIERGARISVETSDAVMHLDGRLWRNAPGNRHYEIEVETGAIAYLTVDR